MDHLSLMSVLPIANTDYVSFTFFVEEEIEISVHEKLIFSAGNCKQMCFINYSKYLKSNNMALNFPNSPTLNQVYTDATSGFSYQWNGTVWISFSAASSSQIKVLDDISGSFTGIAFTFALTSSSISISPPNKQSLIINLGGVIQDPSDDYSVSGSNIIFSTAPSSALSFSGVSLGPAIPVTDTFI